MFKFKNIFKNKLNNIKLGPDGVITQIGHNFKHEYSEKLEEKEKPKNIETLYKLDKEIPPYLYYTNKLNENINLEYGDPMNKPFG